MINIKDEKFLTYRETVEFLGDAEHVDELDENSIFYFFEHKLLVPAEGSQNNKAQFVFNGLISMSDDDYAAALYGQNIDKAPIEKFQLSKYGSIDNGKDKPDLQQFFELKHNEMVEPGVREKQYYSNKIYFKQTAVEKWAEEHGINKDLFQVESRKQNDCKEKWRPAYGYESEGLNALYEIIEKYFLDEKGNPKTDPKGWEKQEVIILECMGMKVSEPILRGVDKVITSGKRTGGNKKANKK